MGVACDDVSLEPPSFTALAPPPYDAPGPYSLESLELILTEATPGGRVLPAVVWLPKVAELDEPPLPASSPVLVFSHGSGSALNAHQFTVEHLVSRGYVVALVEHTGNVGFREFMPTISEIAVYRPQDISRLIDELEVLNAPGAALAGRMDLSRIAAGGHSFGGYTSLVLCGAELDANHLARLCAEAEDDEAFVAVACRSAEAAAAGEPAADPRIDACLLFAPSVTPWFGEDLTGLRAVRVPTLLMSGTLDVFTEYAEHVSAWNAWDKDLYLVTLEGGGHIGFTDVGNDGTMPHARMRELINVYSAAFLDAFLGQRLPALDVLTPTYTEAQLAIDGDVRLEVK